MNAGQPFDGLDLSRVEEIGLNALQTQRQLFYDGWLLRVSPGKAKRARSVNAHFSSTLPLARKIAYCERIYAERGLPALFRMTPFLKPLNLETELEARGYEAFELTRVQIARLDLPPEAPPVADIDFMTPSAAAFAEAVGVIQETTREQQAAYLERMIQSPLTTRAVIAVQDGRPVGTGTVMLEDRIAGVFTMGTVPDMRNRGIAGGLLAAMLRWAWEHGATHAYLQVSADNLNAISVYRNFGFVDAYTYHYRGLPGECH
ncbi:MAG: GNAT family N-acetyltransferase [Betaproteobacteria bacterium]